MAIPPPLLTAGDPLMDALLFGSEEEDDDHLLMLYIRHVKLAIAGYFAISELANLPTPDIARTRLVWQNHVDELINDGQNSFRRYYRMSLPSFVKLCSIIEPKLQVTERCHFVGQFMDLFLLKSSCTVSFVG